MLNALLITLIIIAFSCLICKVASFLEDTERLDNAAVSIHDFTFRDDNGHTYVVTASHVNDAQALLVEVYDLTPRYIFHHVFLTTVTNIATNETEVYR